ncbi:MAG: radical SAM protein [Nanoarchaeota archaeon]
MFNLNLSSFGKFVYQHSWIFIKGIYRRVMFKQPYVFSINIADRCPVSCHCYWRAQARVTELTDQETISFFKKKRKEGYVLAILVGGEPYVRPNLLTEVTKIMPFNWLVTSGTTPLCPLTNTTHVVSIDGATSDTHDKVRRMPGLFSRILKNIQVARENAVMIRKKFPVVIHTTLNAWNYPELPNIVEIWATNGLADGMIVSTMTPIKEGYDEPLRLNHEQRVWIVEELLRLKNIYPKFLFQSFEMFRRLHPDHTKKLTPAICQTASLVESYDASGARIKQCILSEKADCSECGCIVTTMSDSTTPLSLQSFTESLNIASKLTTLTN